MSEDPNAVEPEPKGENPDIKQLREKAKRADDAEAALAVERRRNVMLEAATEVQLDLTDPKTKYFVDNWQGEATKEAFLADATKYGFVVPEAPAPPSIPAAEADALTRIAQNAAGDNTPTTPPTQESELAAAIRAGEVRSPEDIGMWLSNRGQPVAWDGPVNNMEPVPWSQIR